MKNQKLTLAELICEEIKELTPTNTALFKKMVENYNVLASMINDINVMSPEPPFDERADVGHIYACFCYTSAGREKIERIKSRCKQYIMNNTEMSSAETQRLSFLEKTGIICGIIFGCAIFFGIGCYLGETNAKQDCNDNMKARDSLSLVLGNYIELQQKYDSLSISDSIAIFQEKQYNHELRDSIKKVTTSNQFLAETADSSKHIIDSLDGKLKKEIEDSNLLFKELKKTRDSLHNKITPNHKGTKT